MLPVAANGEHRRRQEPAEPAIVDVIRQRQPGIADASREQFHQPRSDRRVDQGHVNSIRERAAL